jgi:hypothetical protein
MFRFTQNHHQGATSSAYLKLRIWYQCACRYNDTRIGTRYVILGKHWMWLPDDGFM